MNDFLNSAPFKNCIMEISNTLIDQAKNFDTVITIYNLLEQQRLFKNIRKCISI